MNKENNGFNTLIFLLGISSMFALITSYFDCWGIVLSHFLAENATCFAGQQLRSFSANGHVLNLVEFTGGHHKRLNNKIIKCKQIKKLFFLLESQEIELLLNLDCISWLCRIQGVMIRW